MNLALAIRETLNITIEELNIGGGFGIYYTEDDDVKPFDYFITPCMKLVETFCMDHAFEKPLIIIEPGRWIIGEAGITLYTIGAIKENGNKKWPSLSTVALHTVICVVDSL